MKSNTITLLILLMLPILSAAQEPATDMAYKKYTGRYGSNSGICLFDDGRFLLYGYATAVFGDYKIDKQGLRFFPDKLERFEVYGHHNKNSTKRMSANFKGFERNGPTYLELGNKGRQRVFNENANCFDGPFVYETSTIPRNITLSVLAVSASLAPAKKGESWTYDNKEAYNDFIFVYNAVKREYEDFQGRVSSREGHRIIQLSNYGGEEGYPLNPAVDDQWREMLEWKKQYKSTSDTDLNTAYVNQHYHVFSEALLSNYQLDKKRNLFVKNPGNTNDEEYYSQNEYQDDRALKKYIKLQPLKIEDSAGTDDKLIPGSIFFSSCDEDTERSYHYNGLKGAVPTGKTTKLDTIAPVVVPPPPLPGRKE